MSATTRSGAGEAPSAVEVLVAGAGPAGCAAAITLARAGRDVLVCDKANFPRDKCCGDGLTAAALRRLEDLGAVPTGLESWKEVGDVCVRSPSGRIARLPLPERAGLYGAVCNRAELDAELVGAARRAGATVLEGRRLAGMAEGATGNGVAAQVDGVGTVAAQYVVGADGMWSTTRRAAAAGDGGQGTYLGEWHAFRRYFSGVGTEASDHLWVWFDDPILPGYAWSFPLSGGRANVGVTLLRRDGTTGAGLHDLFEDVLATPWLRSLLGRNARPESEARSWPIPTRVNGSAPTGLGGRVLFAGDAARLADPLTGEGVAQALESGAAAAEAIIRGDAGGPERVAELYEASLGESLRPDNRFAALLSKMLASSLGARAAVRGANLPVVRAHFGAWLFEDMPRALPFTPRRWRRGVLAAPGAYARLGLAAAHAGVPAGPAEADDVAGDEANA